MEMSILLQLSILINSVLIVIACLLCWLWWRRKSRTAEILCTLRDLELQFASNKAMLNSSYMNTRLARDLAKKNQERWMKFRADMTNLYAMHEFVVIGCSEASERVAEWQQLTAGGQAKWLKRGTEFVEHTCGPWVG